MVITLIISLSLLKSVAVLKERGLSVRKSKYVEGGDCDILDYIQSSINLFLFGWAQTLRYLFVQLVL